MELLSTEHLLDIIVQSLNHMDPRLTGHGERVAYGMMHLLDREGGFPEADAGRLIWTVLLHDIGNFRKIDVKDLLKRENDTSFSHARYGYLFLKHFSPFPEYAPLILYHHSGRQEIETSPLSEPMKRAAGWLQVLDAVDLYRILHKDFSREQLLSYLARLDRTRYSDGAVETVAAFVRDFSRQTQPSLPEMHRALLQRLKDLPLTAGEQEILLQTVVRSIDFRSRYTAMHCATMTAVSDALAFFCGLGEEERRAVHIGAMLHDLGKIATPVEILESPGRLAGEDWEIMKAHVTITEDILRGRVDDTVLNIAIRHHETLNGAGYPYGRDAADLSFAERIVAVADIVSALSEERSYKEPFPPEKILEILEQLCADGRIDKEAVSVLKEHKEELREITRRESQQISALYRTIDEEYNKKRL